MREQTYRQRVGCALMTYHTGQASHIYSVASRLVANQMTTRADLETAAAQLESTGLRGSKTIARILRHNLEPLSYRQLITAANRAIVARHGERYAAPAIRKVRGLVRSGLVLDTIDDYTAQVELTISKLVNKEY